MYKYILSTFIFLITSSAYCGLLLQHSFGYSTDADNISNLASSKMNNYFFIGASLDGGQSLYLGQCVKLWSKSLESDNLANIDTVSLMELGPRIIWYMGEMRVHYLSFAYNPYAKGTRELGGVEQDISGTSMIATYGYQVKLNKVFHLGASISYHMVSIKQIVEGTTETVASESYTMITPMLDINFRF